jgi:arylsulfatase A-like enzyme
MPLHLPAGEPCLAVESYQARGTATPRIDRLASEGIRFNNYTVEAQCTDGAASVIAV